jgi:hypothetical protein
LLFSGTPGPSGDLMNAAGFSIPADVNDLKPEIDLSHLVQIARYEKIKGGIGSEKGGADVD